MTFNISCDLQDWEGHVPRKSSRGLNSRADQAPHSIHSICVRVPPKVTAHPRNHPGQELAVRGKPKGRYHVKARTFQSW